jgi:hypothetical protein
MHCFLREKMKEKYKRQQRKDYMPQKKRGNTSETPL